MPTYGACPTYAGAAMVTASIAATTLIVVPIATAVTVALGDSEHLAAKAPVARPAYTRRGGGA